MKNLIAYFLTGMALFLCSYHVRGQAIEVSGTVTDESGETIPGVSVLEKGTNSGTITDIEGKYKITVSDPDIGTGFFLEHEGEVLRSHG